MWRRRTWVAVHTRAAQPGSSALARGSAGLRECHQQQQQDACMCAAISGQQRKPCIVLLWQQQRQRQHIATMPTLSRTHTAHLALRLAALVSPQTPPPLLPDCSSLRHALLSAPTGGVHWLCPLLGGPLLQLLWHPAHAAAEPAGCPCWSCAEAAAGSAASAHLAPQLDPLPRAGAAHWTAVLTRTWRHHTAQFVTPKAGLAMARAPPMRAPQMTQQHPWTEQQCRLTLGPATHVVCPRATVA